MAGLLRTYIMAFPLVSISALTVYEECNTSYREPNSFSHGGHYAAFLWSNNTAEKNRENLRFDLL